MYYDYYQSIPTEHGDPVFRGSYSINPTSSSSQEAILIYLKELAFYLLKLKEFGANNEIIKENILEAILGIIANIDYSQERFKRLIIILSQDLSQARALYAKLCQQNKLEPKFLKEVFNLGGTSDMVEIIKKSERQYVKRNAMYTFEQKNLFDIMFSLVKNMCIKIVQIKSYKKDFEKAYNCILEVLKVMNFEDVAIEEVKSAIKKCISEDHNLLKTLSDSQEEAYGERQSVYISFAPRTGKAILVSGIDMTQLEAVLEATKGRGVDVYTHGIIMLMAHTLAKFRTYPHLVGHFGKDIDNSLFDFATFPGAILMTRYLFQKVEYLYRGRLFTTDSFAPVGIVKIKDDNFEPLIQAALNLKGFTKKQQKSIKRVGFRQKLMEEKIKEIIGKMEKNEIKHLYIIGLLNEADGSREYFDEFLKLLPKDCYAVSLAYDKNEENILHVDSLYDYLLVYKALEKFNEIKSLNRLNISIFITKCDQYTITNVMNFIHMGVKNIFLCKCIPTLLNPSLAETMRKIFGIKEISSPEQDLAKTLAE
ncbi:MAG: hypothetical protein WCY19_04455 [Candidatus Gastranaerophilaceae bacterium]